MMKSLLVASAIAIPALFLAGCMPPPPPPLTPLQVQTLQTQSFNVSQKVAFTAVMNVFQNITKLMRMLP